ncbi:MAG: prephenate dehydrogenase/arogenate dehydrogenase family protein [Candidatus Bathyarchaeota archaeon]|nr:prephenate dehydrogenase/arogenate dehydrogenase family protein [Candidatus Bathyarchaeota archaeon]
MNIAILGAGKMGIWFAKFYKEKGETVILADRNVEKLAKLKKELNVETADFVDAVKEADRVLICVSINSFEEIVKKISPAVRKGQVVMDICSIKASPVKIMHKHLKNALILGTHPAFGPGSSTLKRKAFILTPTNTKEQKLAEAFKDWLEKEGAHVFIMTPQHHDELMSIVLGFPHFLGVVACDTLLEQVNYSETKKVAGTTYRMLFTLAEAAALETPELFATLQTILPSVKNIEKCYIKKAQEWLQLIQQKDQAALIKKIEALKEKLMKISCDYSQSYDVMYKMLESA